VQASFLSDEPKGHKGDVREASADVRLESKADMCAAKGDVCFAPESGHVRRN
jgi:hypothetical protein